MPLMSHTDIAQQAMSCSLLNRTTKKVDVRLLRLRALRAERESVERSGSCCDVSDDEDSITAPTLHSLQAQDSDSEQKETDVTSAARK